MSSTAITPLARPRIWMLALPLLLWGGVMLYFHFSGRARFYLVASFQPLVPVAGAVLVILAIAYLFWASRESCDDEACTGCGLMSGPIGWKFVIWSAVLIVPLSASVMATRDSFSAVAIQNRGFLDSASMLGGSRFEVEMLPMDLLGDEVFDLKAYLQTNEQGEIIAEVVDLMYAAEDDFLMKDFEGQKVEITGQFLNAKVNNPRGNRFHLMRLFMWCCASDARPVVMLVEPEPLMEFKEMDWIKVRGVVRFPYEGGKRIPLLENATAEPTTAPEEPILF